MNGVWIVELDLDQSCVGIELWAMAVLRQPELPAWWKEGQWKS